MPNFICFLTLILKSCFQDSKKELPIYNPSDFDSKLVDKSLRNVKKNHTAREFSLINQNGTIITSKDYENKIYVVDFFFHNFSLKPPVQALKQVSISM